MRVTATDGQGDALKGVCVFFIRPNNSMPVTQDNVSEVLSCGCLDASGGRSVLQVFQEYLDQVMLPALQRVNNWGHSKPIQVSNFINTLKSHINFLQSK